LSLTDEEVSPMSETASLTVVVLAVGGAVEIGSMDEEFTREASVLAEEVGGTGFLSLAEVVDSLVAELVSLKVTLESGTVAGEWVMVDGIVEATTLLADAVEPGEATAAGVDVGPFEVTVEVAEVVEAIEEVVEAGLTSKALVAEVLVMVKEI